MDPSQPALCLGTHASLLLDSCSPVPEAEALARRSRILSSSYTHLHPRTDPIRFTTQTDPGAKPGAPPSRPPSPFRPPGLPTPRLAPSRVTLDTFLRKACSDCCQGRRRTRSTSRGPERPLQLPTTRLIAPTLPASLLPRSSPDLLTFSRTPAPPPLPAWVLAVLGLLLAADGAAHSPRLCVDVTAQWSADDRGFPPRPALRKPQLRLSLRLLLYVSSR